MLAKLALSPIAQVHVTVSSSPPPEGHLRILFVCARKSLDSKQDISSLLISQLVFEIIDQAIANGKVAHAEILRQAKWTYFRSMLKNKPKTWFRAVYFDCHGQVDQGIAHLFFASELTRLAIVKKLARR